MIIAIEDLHKLFGHSDSRSQCTNQRINDCL